MSRGYIISSREVSSNRIELCHTRCYKKREVQRTWRMANSNNELPYEGSKSLERDGRPNLGSLEVEASWINPRIWSVEYEKCSFGTTKRGVQVKLKLSKTLTREKKWTREGRKEVDGVCHYEKVTEELRYEDGLWSLMKRIMKACWWLLLMLFFGKENNRAYKEHNVNTTTEIHMQGD